MPPLVVAERIGQSFPSGTVLEDVTLGVAEGDRIGVVGRNGDGKSTLLRILSKTFAPDCGRVTWRRDLQVGVVEQTDLLDSTDTAIHAVVGDRLQHEWASDPAIRDVLSGLMGDIDHEAIVSTLSGGQRRRVALARTLVRRWDLLVLDEPTNHLDLEGVTWLAEHVKRRTEALLVVTHDRWFLDEVCTLTWEVHDARVDAYEGGYAAYVLQRVERDRQAAASEERRQNLMRKELAWLRRGAPARTSKPKFRIDAANELIEREPPVRDSVSLAKLATARLGKDVVDLLDVSVEYDGRPVLRDVEWRIAPGERAGILGANGAGKSTLLGLVTGAVAPTSGRVKRGKTVKIAALTQDLADLDAVADDRVSEVVARRRTAYVAEGKEMTPSQLLERLGFTSAQLTTPVKDLSGGQRRRLQLLLILLDEPNVLILDEPTNDMDTDMLAAIEDLLDTWPGTLLVVSHDRYLLERVTDHQFAVLDSHLRHLPGGVEEYLRLRAAGPVDAQPSGPAPAAAKPPAATQRGGQAERQAKKDVVRLERQIERLTAQISDLERAMVEASTEPDRLMTLDAERRPLVEELERAEEAWLEVSAALEG
ncbi:ABC-F family ATP-binding cassette domain-containing protein [Aeromicrobium senzhongii]|uniref:ABC-F family ATP-binding cassette domain-containing protein n=1 Tax=Aeromicrobium senzhongii TaxID=2663859 RepID=A0ABX6SX03_9ACTN|nr:ABC-F family ATP-binding cassette domain-containing protein [Aeromicrobium senzhongii]MTB88019.1 ATP-binding cassette domain-containing protein [Aeromicrobium senzhongii]QNL94974.1 ABC-F family ATP-binding cassette domain-containing protein [Aeromicrobium senzhongii]